MLTILPCIVSIHSVVDEVPYRGSMLLYVLDLEQVRLFCDGTPSSISSDLFFWKRKKRNLYYYFGILGVGFWVS